MASKVGFPTLNLLNGSKGTGYEGCIKLDPNKRGIYSPHPMRIFSRILPIGRRIKRARWAIESTNGLFKVTGALFPGHWGDSAPSIMQDGPEDDPSWRAVLRSPLEDLQLIGDDIFAHLGDLQTSSYPERKIESAHFPYWSIASTVSNACRLHG